MKSPYFVTLTCNFITFNVTLQHLMQHFNIYYIYETIQCYKVTLL